jgi:hypothetical protein
MSLFFTLRKILTIGNRQRKSPQSIIGNDHYQAFIVVSAFEMALNGLIAALNPTPVLFRRNSMRERSHNRRYIGIRGWTHGCADCAVSVIGPASIA